ncbi:MAG: competence/damage-inducible protein A [Ruminococcaceae bacterium]|nr:competence/damage-inducible protein A [Oscillospiraceae bacterium]
MICEIVSVGTELLLGDVTDTNASFLSRALRELGICVYHRQTCGDNPARMREQLSLALSRSDLVIVSGGLGPTRDDITRDVAAELFSMPLVHNEEVAEQIRGYFVRRGIPMKENNLRQAQVPVGAEILQNEWGTAPGLWLRREGKGMILLPGVPSEMKAIFNHRVKERLASESGVRFANRILHFYGISESAVDEVLGDLMARENPTVAPYAGNGEVEVHVTAFGESAETAERFCRETEKSILDRLGEYYYGNGDTSPEQEVVKAFSERGLTLAAAESCTGGLVAQRLTRVSGASEVIGLGVVSYSEEMKKKILGVSADTLANGGVYSKACAMEMARGIRSLAGSDLGIGITGIAGPSGGTKEDPVGTVYIALASEKKEEEYRFLFGHVKSSREEIRFRAATQALILALRHFSDEE